MPHALVARPAKHRPAIFEIAVRSVVMTSPLALDRSRRSAQARAGAWDGLWIYIQSGANYMNRQRGAIGGPGVEHEHRSIQSGFSHKYRAGFSLQMC